MLPNFIIAGGVAAGTSYLSSILMNHPDIYLPKVQRPEPNFFHYSWKFNNGIEWYEKTYFGEVNNQHAIGERSSLLLTSPVAPQLLKQTIPNIKLIFCLRNPVERAWANYRFTVLEGLESLSFDDAIKQESERMMTAEGKWAEVQVHAYLSRSKYALCLKSYLDLFGRENVLVLKSEDLGRYPEENITQVCEFLDVGQMEQLQLPPNYTSPSVIDKEVQIELRAYFGERFSEIVECIRKEGDFSTLKLSDDDKTNVAKLASNLRSTKDTMSQESRKYLQSIFASEINQIKQIVDFNIDDWM